MSKKDDALKLALEALKYPLNQSHENFNVDMAELLAHRAITAIKEAMAEQPAPPPPPPPPECQTEAEKTAFAFGWFKALEQKRKVDSALDRMAENARELGLDYEPIVERVENSVGMGHKAWDMVEPKELAKAFHEALAEQPAQQQEPVAVVKALPMGHNQSDMHYAECQHLPVGTLLYTSPPASKPWVGLTQQDINIAFDDTQEGGGFDDFARAIEAKLREKNAPQQSKEDA